MVGREEWELLENEVVQVNPPIFCLSDKSSTKAIQIGQQTGIVPTWAVSSKRITGAELATPQNGMKAAMIVRSSVVLVTSL